MPGLTVADGLTLEFVPTAGLVLELLGRDLDTSGRTLLLGLTALLLTDPRLDE